MACKPMIRQRPLKERAITIVKLDNIYYWTCSACYWKHSFDDVKPFLAVDSFGQHICEDHPEPTGHLPDTQVQN
jgi:hypothetical protein